MVPQPVRLVAPDGTDLTVVLEETADSMDRAGVTAEGRSVLVPPGTKVEEAAPPERKLSPELMAAFAFGGDPVRGKDRKKAHAGQHTKGRTRARQRRAERAAARRAKAGPR